MKENYSLTNRIKAARNMLLYLIMRSKGRDKNITLHEIREFLLSIYELIEIWLEVFLNCPYAPYRIRSFRYSLKHSSSSPDMRGN